MAVAATSALWWYHLPHHEQYSGTNAQLYETLAKIGGRDDHARTVSEILQSVEGQILEIGAGTGLVSRRLAERHADRLLCTDIEPAVLALNPHTHKRVADCRNLPLASASMDAIVGVGVYRYLEKDSLDGFWAEMRRVIRATGRVVLGEFHPSIIGIRGLEIDARDAEHRFLLSTCHISPAHAKIGDKVLRIGTNVTYTFLPKPL